MPVAGTPVLIGFYEDNLFGSRENPDDALDAPSEQFVIFFPEVVLPFDLGEIGFSVNFNNYFGRDLKISFVKFIILELLSSIDERGRNFHYRWLFLWFGFACGRHVEFLFFSKIRFFNCLNKRQQRVDFVQQMDIRQINVNLL